MPELPEVEVTRQGLLPHIRNRRVLAIKTSGKNLRQEMPEEQLRQWLPGSTVENVERRGKYLLFQMSNHCVLVIHLGMSGRLGLFAAGSERVRHDHLCIMLDKGLELRLNDCRRFGTALLWPPKDAAEMEHEFMTRIGVEPLENAFTGDKLKKLAQGRRKAVKQLLMDSRLIAGIGNIYANEALFFAGLHPATAVDCIQAESWDELARSCRQVLLAGIAAGGASISDFLSVSGESGYFQLQLKVYGRAGKPCQDCNRSIEKIIIGGRASFFCPQCQR